jgi:DNA-binding response OmpR family regulator
MEPALAEPAVTIAILVANPALGSVLTMVLAGDPRLRVRPFDSEVALRTYMRLAAVDLLVADFDSVACRADRLTGGLRADSELGRRDFQVIALTSVASAEIKDRCISAGIDEMIVKPMSPKYLLERVTARIARRAPTLNAGYRPPRSESIASLAVRRARAIAAPGSNVIPLFGGEPLPQH